MGLVAAVLGVRGGCGAGLPRRLVQRRIGQAPCARCRIIDERWDLRSRQDENDGFMAAFKTPETYWYAKEYLVEPLAP